MGVYVNGDCRSDPYGHCQVGEERRERQQLPIHKPSLVPGRPALPPVIPAPMSGGSGVTPYPKPMKWYF